MITEQNIPIFTKANVVHMLQNNIVTVKFQKVDGTERLMKCTLLAEYMPSNNAAVNTVLLLEDNSPNNISVWDVDVGAWRSFRVNSLKSISVG